MVTRIQRVFNRYAIRHLALRNAGFTLNDAEGHKVGQIDKIMLHNGRFVIEGNSIAENLSLDLGERHRVWTAGSTATGNRFRLDLPYSQSPASVTFGIKGQTRTIGIPGFSPMQHRIARAALWPKFALDSIWAVPASYRWLRYHDVNARARVKKLLGLGAMVEERELDVEVFPTTPPKQPHGTGAIAMLLPVYGAFELLPDVLARIENNTDLDWQLVIVEDASPDPEILPYLRAWASRRGNVTLLENPTNLGFVKSVNRALTLLANTHLPVVLLNSDAFLPPGWASRLVEPLKADARIASVTPMSNDAELMSVPVICARTDLAMQTCDEIDRAAQKLALEMVEIPTGVGFCMALSPRFLAQVPQLDQAFGPGYGEEVDWCQKTRALGGRHVCQTRLFVEHRGGSSFGTAAKQALLAKNGSLISARYPGFDQEVQQFIGDDPLLTARLMLGLAWVAALGFAVPIYLAHSMGGGAEHYLQNRIAEDVRDRGAAVVLRVGGEYRWEIAVHSAAGITRGSSNDTELMLRLLKLLPQRTVIYSCGVGDPDPVALPQILIELGEGQRVEILIHDYLMVSPSYTLLDTTGAFHGVPLPGQEGRGHTILRPDGTRVDLAGWQSAWHRLLSRADKLVVFSQSSCEVMAQAYPDLAERFDLHPHQKVVRLRRLEVRKGPRPVIGVLGNIGSHKGAALLNALSRYVAQTRAADLVLIGNIDPNFNLARPAIIHGDYEPKDIPALAAKYGVSCWFIPSVWSETFSFTTHEALSTELPVICFDLGAQAEAVRRAIAAGAAGAVLPLKNGRGDPADVLTAVQMLTQHQPAAKAG